MGRKRYQAEQIISKLREAEVLLANAGFEILLSYYSLIKFLSKYKVIHIFIKKRTFPPN